MKKGYGIFPPMLTVWKSDETYDVKASERYMDWLIKNGIQSVVCCGSTGENIAMSTEVQKQVIEHVVKYIGGRIPVYAGTGRYSTLETIELSKHAQTVGADGLMLILPYYLKPYKEAAMNHFRAVKKAVDLPIILYNNPWFAGYELTAKETKILADEGVLQGVKAAHGDASRVSEMRYECKGEFTVLYGHDYAALQGYAAGAEGWLSGFTATFPKQCRELQEAVMVERDLEKGLKIWDKFLPLVSFFMDPKVNEKVHWLEMLKWAVNAQGVPVGIPRSPLRELAPEIRCQMLKPMEILLG